MVCNYVQHLLMVPVDCTMKHNHAAYGIRSAWCADTAAAVQMGAGVEEGEGGSAGGSCTAGLDFLSL